MEHFWLDMGFALLVLHIIQIKMNMHAGILWNICVIYVNLVGVNRNIWTLMLFASEVGCEIAEVGFSGRFHVNVGTPGSTDITEKGGKKGKIISTKYRFLFDIIAFAYSSDTGLHVVVFNEMQCDFVIKCNRRTHTLTWLLSTPAHRSRWPLADSETAGLGLALWLPRTLFWDFYRVAANEQGIRKYFVLQLTETICQPATTPCKHCWSALRVSASFHRSCPEHPGLAVEELVSAALGCGGSLVCCDLPVAPELNEMGAARQSPASSEFVWSFRLQRQGKGPVQQLTNPCWPL